MPRTSLASKSCFSADLAAASRRLAMTTRVPCRANAPATAKPMPLRPPVMSATFALHVGIYRRADTLVSGGGCHKISPAVAIKAGRQRAGWVTGPETAATSGIPGRADPTAKISLPAQGAARRSAGPRRPGPQRQGPHKPSLDQMGPGVEAVPDGRPAGRSKMGRPGMRGGFKPRRR